MRPTQRDSASNQGGAQHGGMTTHTAFTATDTIDTDTTDDSRTCEVVDRTVRNPLSWRTLVLVGAPLAWIPIAFLHPAASPDSVYKDLAAAADRWLFVHLAQLVLTLWFGVALWMAVAGRRGTCRDHHTSSSTRISRLVRRVRHGRRYRHRSRGSTRSNTAAGTDRGSSIHNRVPGDELLHRRLLAALVHLRNLADRGSRRSCHDIAIHRSVSTGVDRCLRRSASRTCTPPA